MFKKKFGFIMRLFLSIIYQSRVYLLIFGIMSVISLFFIFYFIPLFESSVFNEKKLQLMELCTLMNKIPEEIEYYPRKENFKPLDAKQLSLQVMQKMRFGKDNKNYFFIINTDGVMIFHPYLSDLIGKNILSLHDSRGNYYIKDFIDISNKSNSGFSNYIFSKYDDSKKEHEKITYITTYKPWGWIIGAGMYVDDIQDDVSKLRLFFTYIIISLLVIVFLTIFLLNRFIIKPMKNSLDNIGIMESDKFLINYYDIINYNEFQKKENIVNNKINYIKRLSKTMDGIIKSLILTIENRDAYTSGHQQRVANISVEIAKKLNLPEISINCIKVAALLHDLGKISIPAEILNKPLSLIDQEVDLIKRHVIKGSEIINNIDFPWPLSQIILQHHERLDGSGYPYGLESNQICMEAKILAVADVVEAMSSHRPYRSSFSLEEIIYELNLNKNIKYDPVIVEACIEIISGDFNFIT
jgi:putative nucleotidyltransferase with HDIG domain